MTSQELNVFAYAVVPSLRSEAAILAEINNAKPGTGTAPSANLAPIELAIKRGEQHYNRRRYAKALDEFRTAQALAFKLLRADFDPNTYLMGRPTSTLPVSGAIEKSLLESSVRFTQIDAVKTAAAQATTVESIISAIYQRRTAAKTVLELDVVLGTPQATNLHLLHLYAYVIPVKIGDCYQELGQYSQAESNYTSAAAYTYLNKEIEGTTLWIRLARNSVEWGDSLYKSEDLINAKAQYAKLITEDGKVPASLLYQAPGLSIPAEQAKSLIANLLAEEPPEVNGAIAREVLDASARMQQIANGLDFYDLALSPIHTFEYLQSVARAFAQQAAQSEREFITFKNHQELEEAARRDLESAAAMADAEVDGRSEQLAAAREDQAAAQKGLELAKKRRDDAIKQRAAYAASSSTQIWAQAAATALSGGQNARYAEISELADKLARGESVEGKGALLAAAEQLLSGRRTRTYELQRMQDNIQELDKALAIAKEQVDAAVWRVRVAQTTRLAARQNRRMTDAALSAFDKQLFTPESWQRVANLVRSIARSYLTRAIRLAKLMERAYNLENDTELKSIKNEYGRKLGNPESNDNIVLLGGDSLLRDIDAFTFRAITAKTRKNSRLKDVLSVASMFPAQFSEFTKTGLLSIETDLYEFDRLHPGFYNQRLEAVEVQIIGLVSEAGINGTLTAGGVTRYRKKDGSAGQRLHQVDTMALSDFVLRDDILLYSSETGVRGLFQGLGIGSTWQLHLPKRSNDFDFARIFDVQLVLYYTAAFDPLLRTSVLAKPPRPDEKALLRNYTLRHDFPDAWYAFYKNGVVHMDFDRARLPANQQNFRVNQLMFRVVPHAGAAPQGIDLRVTTPAGKAIALRTDENGVASLPGETFPTKAGFSPFGTWKLEAIGGAALNDSGALKFERVYNIQVGLEYGFDHALEEV